MEEIFQIRSCMEIVANDIKVDTMISVEMVYGLSHGNVTNNVT